MFGIGRRSFFDKTLKKAGVVKQHGAAQFAQSALRSAGSIGKRAALYSRALALLMITVLVAQMLTMIPGIGASSIPPVEDELWMYPEIQYRNQTIYKGMKIPVGAEMNAVYEFTISGRAFPVEVLLPDVLKAVAGDYDAAAFYVNGQKAGDATVKVNHLGDIRVYFDPPEPDDEDDLNDEDAMELLDAELEEECCESCDGHEGSGEPIDAYNGTEPHGNSVNLTENVVGNDGSPSENASANGAGNTSSGSTEPVDNNANTVNNDANSGSDSSGNSSGGGSSSEPPAPPPPPPPPEPPPASEPAPSSEVCNEAGMAAQSSASMFNNIGALTASANEGTENVKFRVEFEIPVKFDPENLPEPPDFEWNEEEEEWEIDEWVVDVFNTEYDRDRDKHEGEYVEIEIVHELAEPEPIMLEIMALDSGNYQAVTNRNFIGSINWNDGADRFGKRPKETDALNLTLYISIPDLNIPERPIVAEDLLNWGWIVPVDDSVPAREAALAEAQKRIDSPARSITGGVPRNLWTYTYAGLPTSLRDIDGLDYSTSPPTPELGTTFYEINYWFKMDDVADIEDDYFVLDLRPGTVGYRCTVKQDFEITKEWKDHKDMHEFRPEWDEFLASLTFRRAHGLSGDDLLGIVGAPATIGDVTREVVNADISKLIISNIPAFNPVGDPYHYYVIEDPIFIPAADNPWKSSTLRYEPTYVNEGNYGGDFSKGYNGGTIINRLTDEAVFKADKVWQDDGAVSNRPTGIFQLYRYPETAGMSWQTASPVSGMQIAIKTTDFDIGKAFTDLPNFDTLYPEGLPQFDTEGVEYVYFIKERYTYSNPPAVTEEVAAAQREYKGFPVYTGVYLPDSAKPHASVDDILFNGGTLNNRRVNTADLTVTKTWEAVARQSMNADVEVMVKWRLANPPQLPGVGFVPVPKERLGGDKDGIFVLDGFRAEIMTITESLSLPKYNDKGVLYEYEITEHAVTIDGSRVPDDDEKPIDKDRLVFDDGYIYKILREINGGNTKLTNRLIGDAEVRIRKIWNDATLPVPNATFKIYGENGVEITSDKLPDGATITIENATIIHHPNGDVTYTPHAVPARGLPKTATDFTIEPENAWYRAAVGDADGNVGDWLVIKGLPRYDEHGREIEYTVREVPIPPGYHNRFGFSYYDRLDEITTSGVTETVRIGVTESTFINTPTTSGGRYMRVSKEWADDGDLACREAVEMQLVYIGPDRDQNVLLGTETLTRDMDWTGFIELSHSVSVQVSPGVWEMRKDHNYNNYTVRELTVGGKAVTYDGAALSTIGEAYGARLGYAETTAHRYAVFARHAATIFTTPPETNLNPGSGGYVVGTADGKYIPGEKYFSHYTFKNVRQGDVVIDLEKIWHDDDYHWLTVPQRVQIDIKRKLNHEGGFFPLNHDTDGHTPVAGGFDGTVYLQRGVTGLGLKWNSTTHLGVSNKLPKYNADGVLYIYSVTETQVHVMPDNTNPDFNPIRSVPAGGSYSLLDGDSNKYSVGYSSEYIYGDHNYGQAATFIDIYKYEITNQRSASETFEIYKLWHDVGRNIGTFDPRVENHVRPDIYLTLYQSYKIPSSTAPEGYTLTTPVLAPYVKRLWSTTGEFNDYYWKCTFDPLPRYVESGTYAGREIVYYVHEEMPNRGTSEYVTEYYNSTAKPVLIESDDEFDGITRGLITSLPIHGLPPGIDDEAPMEMIENGGIIINRRVAERDLMGSKVWKNVPTSNTEPLGFPTVVLRLMERLNHMDPAAWKQARTLTAVFPDRTLDGGRHEFTFVSDPPGVPLPKYNDYGVYILYRALEMPPRARGYNAPVYNDYIMEITNEYDVSPTAPQITVSIEKTWDVSVLYDTSNPDLQDDLRPTATFELWRVMTTAGTWASRIDKTEVKVAVMDVPYSVAPERHTFEAKHFTDPATGRPYGIPTEEGNRLLQIGYNSQDYYYYVKEVMDGYSRTIEPEDDPDPVVGFAKHFSYEISNVYDGSTSLTGGYIKLQGEKDWIDNGNAFGTRPTSGSPVTAAAPAVTLSVWRAIANNPTAPVNITGSVDIVWSIDDEDDNKWHYVVVAKPIAGQVAGRVGDPLGATDDMTLFRYAVTGDLYVYYVEEAPANHHYDIEAGAAGSQVAPADNASALWPNPLRMRAAGSGDVRTASFVNRLRTTDVRVSKVWNKDVGGAMTKNELDLMIPDSLTFVVEYREMTGVTQTQGWLPFPNAGTPYTVSRDKAAIIRALGDGNSMTIVFNNPLLPRFGSSSTITREYRLVETEIGGNPISGNTGFDVTGNGTGTITNTVETIPLRIRKTWDDDNDRDGERPDSITFRIVRDGNQAQAMTVTLNAKVDSSVDSVAGTAVTVGPNPPYYNVFENTWQVPRYQVNGSASTYTVEELYGDDKTRGLYNRIIGVTPSKDWIMIAPTVTSPMGYEFTNKHDKIRMPLTIRKTWDDPQITALGGPGVGEIRPPMMGEPDNALNIWMTLQRRDGPGGTWLNVLKTDPLMEGIAGFEPTVRINTAAPGAWTHTWTGLVMRHDQDGRYQYRVIETNAAGQELKVPGYHAEYSRGGGTSSTDVDYVNYYVNESNISHGLDIKNKLDTLDLSVEKSWIGTSSSEFADTHDVDIRLYYRLEGENESQWKPTTGAAGTHKLTGAPWTHKFTGLPLENNAGVKYQYTVREVSIGGVAVADGVFPFSYSSSIPTVTVGAVGNPSIDKNSPTNITVTNTLQTRGSISVEKFWSDEDNQDGVRPESVQVVLIRDLGTTEQIISEIVTLGGSQATNPSTPWQHTWENLPRYIKAGVGSDGPPVVSPNSTYHVFEIPPNTDSFSQYTAGYQVGGATGFNSGVSAGVNIVVNGTTYTNPIVAPVDFSMSNTKVNIENEYKPNFMRLTATKGWDDTNYSSITRPTSVTLQLWASTNADGTGRWKVDGEVTIPISGAWSYTWENLPIKRNASPFTNASSQQLYYSVTEVNPVGYTPGVIYNHAGTYGASTSNGTRGDVRDSTNLEHTAAITNTLNRLASLTVRKAWEDSRGVNGNILTPGVNPFAITGTVVVQLEYRLAATAQFQTPTEWENAPGVAQLPINGPSWTATFTQLPIQSSSGRPFEYRVREVSIGGVTTGNPYSYTWESGEVSATSPAEILLTNKLVERGNITVTKEWDDRNNQDGIRTATTTVRVRLVMNMNQGAANGEVVSAWRILGPTNWSTTFENLPLYGADGITKNSYHVQEEIVTLDGYELPTFRVGGTVGETGTFTAGTGLAAGFRASADLRDVDGNITVNVINRRVPATMNVSVIKDWDDQLNAYLTRPTTGVQLMLQSTTTPGNPGSWQNVPTSAMAPTPPELVAQNPRTVNAPWTTAPAVWTGLPIMRNTTGSQTSPGHPMPVFYRVVELDVTGYTATYSFDAVTDGTNNYPAGEDTRSFLALAGGTNNGKVTNILETVDITVDKTWDDHYNFYRIRPSALEFTLQRRAGTDDFVNVTTGAALGTVVTFPITGIDTTHDHGVTRATDSVTFTGLPKYRADGELWEYRAIETAATFAAPTGNVSAVRNPDYPLDLTKGILGDINAAHYEFESENKRDATSGNFTTEVENSLVVIPISISGTKHWRDNPTDTDGKGEDIFGSRPDFGNLELRVWYLDKSNSPYVWEMVDSDDLDPIQWTVGPDEFDWNYLITGFGLTKFEPGTAILREYIVQEVLVADSAYDVDQDELIRPGTGVPTPPENSTLGERIIGGDKDGNIENASFVNALSKDVTDLRVEKTRDYGPLGPFTFKVYFSGSPITEMNKGALYINHSYRVFTGTLEEYAALPDDAARLAQTTPAHIDSSGEIEISHGQVFILSNIPKGLYFSVEEVENEDFVVSPLSAVEMRRQIARGVDLPTLVQVHNLANREISIINETPNEGLYRGIPGGLTNAGGQVTVETPTTMNPDRLWDSDEEIENALAVLWKPDIDRFWVYGNEITIEWIDFGPSQTLNTATIRNYLNPDGSLKTIGECDIDNPVFRTRFQNASLGMRNGAVRLELCRYLENMPRSVAVYVLFLPTIAVNNVTEGNAGGRVRVECPQSGGNLNNNADGVPSLGAGKPYIGTTKVYGLPDPGYRVDWDYIVLRNLNDLDGPFELVELDANGYFTVHLETWIAGYPEVVEKNGRATEGSIMVEILHNLPVPLQIDLRFVPDTGGGGGTGGNRWTQGDGLPKTGIESVIVTLILGLATSLIAGTAVVLVIRYQNAKERRYSK